MATSAIATATNALTNMRGGMERTLVQRAQRGDQEAFATLFELHKGRVRSVCLALTRDVAEAEDMTQETFLRVFRNVASFRGDSSFSTWLHRIAVNTVLMNRRRSKNRPTLSVDEPVASDSPLPRHHFGRVDPTLSGAIDRILLHRAIEELPAGCQRVFALYAVHGYQHREIARMLNCSIGNSKAQFHKAKVRMRDLLVPKPISVRRQNAIRQEECNSNDIQ